VRSLSLPLLLQAIDPHTHGSSEADADAAQEQQLRCKDAILGANKRIVGCASCNNKKRT
jgi:hypothetical protein